MGVFGNIVVMQWLWLVFLFGWWGVCDAVLGGGTESVTTWFYVVISTEVVADVASSGKTVTGKIDLCVALCVRVV